MTLQEALNKFIRDKQVLGLSPVSIDDYRNIISIMVNSLGPSVSLEQITYDMIETYMIDLHNRGLSRSTVATYIRNSRIFLRWVNQEYGLSFNPDKIKVPKSPKKIVHIYNDAEIQYLFSCLQTSIPWITARNNAIIGLMLDSGIRQCELCSLKKKDIDNSRMVIKVTGKGAKERLVPFGIMSRTLLESYLSQCPFVDSPYAFMGRQGKPLSKNAVRLFTYRLQKELPFELSSHKLRHNFATNYCVDNFRKTGNTGVYDLSILMGHESMETTKKYEHFAHEILATENHNSHLDKVFNCNHST